MKITAKRLRELLNYDPLTGVFTFRLARKGRFAKVGEIAGRIRPDDGGRRLGLDGGRYWGNQIAWLYVTGEWPSLAVDHINGDRSDDRFANLRLATGSENLANARRPRHNTSGLKGANWHAKAGKWRATIKKDRTPIHIGYFATAAEAHAAYMAKAKELFGEFARAA